jgi:lipoprotein NlpD
MRKNRLVLSIVLAALVAACSTTRNPAPVVERSPGGMRQADNARMNGARNPVRPPDAKGYYTVKKGDTLLHIAQEFGQNYHDLITWNNLNDPNDIRVDQVLRVLPPENGAGAQMGSVNTASGIEVRPLASPSPPVAAVATPTFNKSGPRGDKRPYSEATLAELQKPDAAVAIAAPHASNTKSESAKMPNGKKAEKSNENANAASNAADESVSWMWPAEGKVIRTFSERTKGIDIAGKAGEQVVAAGAGKVMYAGSGIRGYGNLVILKHTNNLLSAYAHNKTILVKEGQTVSKGQKIAEMGNSDADTVKLHFEIRQQGKPVDPTKFLPSHIK